MYVCEYFQCVGVFMSAYVSPFCACVTGRIPHLSAMIWCLSQAELFTGSLPVIQSAGLQGEKLHRVFHHTLDHLSHVMNGFCLPEPFFSIRVSLTHTGVRETHCTHTYCNSSGFRRVKYVFFSRADEDKVWYGLIGTTLEITFTICMCGCMSDYTFMYLLMYLLFVCVVYVYVFGV